MEDKKTDDPDLAFKEIKAEIKRLENVVDDMQHRHNTMSQALESIKDLSELISKNFERLAEQFIRSLAFAEAVMTVLDKNDLVSKESLMEAWEAAEKELLGTDTRIVH